MADLIWVVLMAAAAFAFFQLALLVLLVGGLILHPRETVGFLLLGGIVWLVETHFWLSLPLLAFIVFGAVAGAREKTKPPPDVPRLPAPPEASP